MTERQKRGQVSFILLDKCIYYIDSWNMLYAQKITGRFNPRFSKATGVEAAIDAIIDDISDSFDTAFLEITEIER